jgi:hypothetical protein
VNDDLAQGLWSDTKERATSVKWENGQTINRFG